MTFHKHVSVYRKIILIIIIIQEIILPKKKTFLSKVPAIALYLHAG